MSYTEALERLLGEIRKLSDKVDALDQRLRGLEENGAAAAPPAAAREGSFGPEVQRSDPTRHQRAVDHAKALNGSATPPERREEEAASESPAKQSHRRALQRIREMRGPTAEPEPQVRWEADAGEAETEAEAEAEPDLSGAIPVDLIRGEPQE